MPIVVKERTRAATVVLPVVVRISPILRVLAGCLALLLCILHGHTIALLWLQQQQQQPHSTSTAASVVVVNKKYQGPSSHHSGTATTLDSSFSLSDHHHHPNNDDVQQQQLSSSTSKNTGGQEHNQQGSRAKAPLVKHQNTTHQSLAGSTNLDRKKNATATTVATTTTQGALIVARAIKAAEHLRRQQEQLPHFPLAVARVHVGSADDNNKKNIISSATTTATATAAAYWWGDEHNDFDPLSNVSVFYNAYISPTDPSTAITIIREQLRLMMQSSSSSRRSDAWPATVNNSYSVYYNIIGHDYYNNNNDNTTTKNNATKNATTTTTTLCPSGMDCRFMRYYPAAVEDVTLTELHKYCQRYPEHSVLYLHDKGSFHGTPKNHKKRIQMTTELMSAPPCKGDDETSSSSRRRQRLQCNVCTVQFNHLPHWHATNNMWSASCRHVRRLISPQEFASRRYGTMNAMLGIPALLAVLQSGNNANATSTTTTNKSTTTTSDDLRTDLLCLYEHFRPEEKEARSITEWMDRFGHLDRLKLGRYLWENWVWMHPDTQPCDIIIREEEEKGHDNNASSRRQRRRKFFLQRAPRKGFHRLVHHAKADSGMSELYRMRGLLVQLYYLYRAVPPGDSWFWSYYRRAVDASPICEHRINE